MKLMNFNLDPKRKKEVVTLIIVFLAVLTVSAFAVYFIAGRQSVRDNSRQAPQAGVAAPECTPADRRSAANKAGARNFLARLIRANRGEMRTTCAGWGAHIGRIAPRR